MNKRDYVFMSSTVKQAIDSISSNPEQRRGAVEVAVVLGAALEQKCGPKFDRRRFLQDCGVKPL